MSRRRTIAILKDVMTNQGGDHPLNRHIRTSIAAEHVASVMRLVDCHEIGNREFKKF